VDVTNGASVEAAVEEVFTRWGAVHVLVNTRASSATGNWRSIKMARWAAVMSDEQFDSVIAVT